MWTREQIKRRAKSVLKGSYWKAFLVSIILSIMGANRGGFNFNWNINNNNDRFRRYTSPLIIEDARYMLPYIIPIVVTVLVVTVLVVCFRIFIGYALEVGGRRYFLRAAENNVDLNNLGYSFGDVRYINIIKTMLYKGVLIFFWSLLLIIPGIIKSYAYRMVPYILSDNPEIGYKRALEISNDMTYGQKADIFVLDLSFIGWYILGALALGVGVLFVNPYVNATEAELYLVLRQNAINNGICSKEELMIDEFIK